jgi:hypothetical protein
MINAAEALCRLATAVFCTEIEGTIEIYLYYIASILISEINAAGAWC